MAVVSAARAGGALTVAITNHPDSPLGEAAEHVLPCRAGRELAIPATKTYVAQLVVVAALVEAIRPSTDLSHGLAACPPSCAPRCAPPTAGWRARTERDRRAGQRRWMPSPGPIAPWSCRAGTTWPPPSSWPSSSRRPAACSRRPTPPPTSRMARLSWPGRGSRCWPSGRMDRWAGWSTRPCSRPGHAAGCRSSSAVRRPAAPEGALALPFDLPEALTPIVYVVPGQLLVEAVARRRGISPDAPAGLGKVTRTR